MNWELLLDYLKYFTGIIFTILSYSIDFKYSEIGILIGGLIILSTRVTIKFGKNGSKE